jgi:non-canonical purine NTP pyrophosphatase (RdgB/HAM1 family)
MTKIFYITGNDYKFKDAKRYANKFGFDLIQKKLEIKEIQSDSIENIAKDKAKLAFKILEKPLIVSDSGWNVPSLKGFPGPYMHYINKWFEPEDFLKLMKDKKDKSIILEDIICAASLNGFKIFKKESKGKFINHPRGKGLPSDRVIVLNGNKYTIAERQNKNQWSVNDSDLWKKVYQWSETI